MVKGSLGAVEALFIASSLPRVSNSVSCNFETGSIRVVSKLKVRHDAEERTNERTSGRINWRIWSLKRNWTLLRMDCGQWVVANGSLVHRIRFIGKVYDCVSLLYDEGVYVYFTRVGVWRDKPQYFTGLCLADRLTMQQGNRGAEALAEALN